MSKQFYYQLKGKSEGSGDFGGNWAWPPVFSGKVKAVSKKEARKLIEADYGRAFPLRVLTKDLFKEHYLLYIREIHKDDDRTNDLFKLKQCKQCKKEFKVIDKYNDFNEQNKGQDFCSSECSSAHYQENHVSTAIDTFSISKGVVIYKITNTKTNQCYIGQTSQVFTLRWYQHFYQNGSCKFHKAIKASEITDWEFTLLEVITDQSIGDKKRHIDERELYYIEQYDSIANGYNSVVPIKNKET